MLKNSKLQTLLSGIVIGGLLAWGISLFSPPPQATASSHGGIGRYQIVRLHRAAFLKMDTVTGKATFAVAGSQKELKRVRKKLESFTLTTLGAWGPGLGGDWIPRLKF